MSIGILNIIVRTVDLTDTCILCLAMLPHIFSIFCYKPAFSTNLNALRSFWSAEFFQQRSRVRCIPLSYLLFFCHSAVVNGSVNLLIACSVSNSSPLDGLILFLIIKNFFWSFELNLLLWSRIGCQTRDYIAWTSFFSIKSFLTIPV